MSRSKHYSVSIRSVLLPVLITLGICVWIAILFAAWSKSIAAGASISSMALIFFAWATAYNIRHYAERAEVRQQAQIDALNAILAELTKAAQDTADNTRLTAEQTHALRKDLRASSASSAPLR